MSENNNNDSNDIRMPNDDEMFGIVKQRLGGSRMKVVCLDGNTRTCRVPGRLKRYLWVREGDIVLVEPWDLSNETKGDVVHKYQKNEADYLRKKGYLKKLEDVREF